MRHFTATSRYGRRDNVFDADGTEVPTLPYRRITLKAQDVAESIHLVLDGFWTDRGGKPGHLLLGWETWLQLGAQLRRNFPDTPVIRASEFRGVPIVVDENMRHGVVALPTLDDVRFCDDDGCRD